MLRELRHLPSIVCLLSILLIVASAAPAAQQIPATSASMSKEFVDVTDLQDNIILSYTTHDPITITADGDFSSQGFPGSGTSEVPFVIEGYNITTTGDSISIANTDVHFVIRDCLLVGADESGNGVKLADVINGEIRGNTIIEKFNGIFLTSSSSGNKILQNTISECADGVVLFSSSNTNIVDENNIFDNIWGIILSGSSNNQVVNNTITGNNDGVTLGMASDNTLLNNTFSGNDDDIDIDSNSDNNLIYLNVFADGSNNVVDDGTGNHWNTTGKGNYWSDYNGTGVVTIPGGASSIDYHPYIFDITAPQINQPTDIDYEEGTTSHEIVWIVSDLHPSHYDIFQNGSHVASDSWNGSSITVIIDGLSIGSYNYTIVVNDTSGNSATDTVRVTVQSQETTTTTSTTTMTTTTTTNTETATDTETTTDTTTTTSFTNNLDLSDIEIAFLGASGIIVVVAVLIHLRGRRSALA